MEAKPLAARFLRRAAAFFALTALLGAPLASRAQAPLLGREGTRSGIREAVALEWREESADRALRTGLAVLAEAIYLDLLGAPGLGQDRVERIRLRLASALIHQQRFADAGEVLDAIPREYRSATYYLYASIVEAGKGENADAEAIESALRLIVPEVLQPEDRPWYFLMQALLAEARGKESRLREYFERARAEAVSAEQAAFFESLILRQEFRATGATEDLAARLRARMESMEGDPAAFPYVREYAIVLHELGRSAEATGVIDRELAGSRAYGSREREQLLLLKALILGADSLGGRATLSELVRNGQSRDVMSIALQLLVRDRGALESAELMRFFNEMIARADTHPLLGQLYFMRSQLALALGDAEQAEEDARLLLERFPGLREITNVYRLLAFASLQRNPPEYRTAADFLVRLRDSTEEELERRQLNRQIGDCYFVNGDYANAADFYLAARGSGEATEVDDGLFLRLVTAEVQAGRIEAALRHVDEADFRGRTTVVERWKAEWNLVQALQASGQTGRALGRVRLLLTDAGEGSVPAALDLRLRWLEAWLAFRSGEGAQTGERVDALLARIEGLPDTALGPAESELLRTEVALLRAEILIQSGEAEAGLEEIGELRERFTGSFAAERSFLTEANHLASVGDLAGAQAVLGQLAADYPASALAPQALFEAARYGELRGPEHFAGAVRLLNNLTERYPDDALVFFAQLKQGDLLRLMNDFAGARIVYEDLINRQPDHPRRYLAEIARADSILALARDNPVELQDVALVLERLLELPGLPVDLQVETAFKWGFALARQGDERAAREVFTLAAGRYLLGEDGGSSLGETGRYWMSRMLLELGTLLEKAGELAEAREVYGGIVERNLPGSRLAQARSDALLVVDR